jgi:hypothetical protein
LVGLLKHAGIDVKILTWDLQVNSALYRSSWCGSRLLSPLRKQEKLPAEPRIRSTSHLPPGEERPNAWTSGRQKNKSVGDNKTCVQTQTDDFNPSIDDTAQKDHLNSDGQAINIPTVLTNKKRERSTQTGYIQRYAANIEKTH